MAGSATDTACSCRRGDRKETLFAAVHESAVGTNAKCRHVRYLVAFWGKTDNICSMRVLRILTRSRHWHPQFAVLQIHLPLDDVVGCYRWPEGEHMRRRKFITLLGGAAAWPVVARGQSSTRRRLIGAIGGASGESARPQTDAMRQGMRELGYVDYRKILRSRPAGSQRSCAFAGQRE